VATSRLTLVPEGYVVFLSRLNHLARRHFPQLLEGAPVNHELFDQAKNNSMENFRLVFDPKFINTIVTRMDANQSIFKQVLDDQEFQDILKDFYVRKMYSRLRNTEAPPPAG
jgi:hypothetical protein